MALLETIFGGLLGIVLIVGFCLWLLAHFLDFVFKGLKLLAIFAVLAVIALVIDVFGFLVPDDRERADSSDFEEFVQGVKSVFRSSEETSTDVDSFIEQFLLAYAANDRTETAYYMDPDASITQQHLDYMIYQARNNISLELISYQLLDVDTRANETLEVITSEQFAVTKDGHIKDVRQQILYTISLASGSPQISGLEVLSN